MKINFKVIGLTRLEIKPKSTALKADALTTRQSKLSEVAYAGGYYARAPLSSSLYKKVNQLYFFNCSTVLVIVYSNTVFSLLLLQLLKSLDEVNTALIEFLEASRPNVYCRSCEDLIVLLLLL